MQTLKQGLEEFSLMTKLGVELEARWRDRLLEDFPQQDPQTRSSIVCWLIGEDIARFDDLDSTQLAIAKQAMEYRYRILCQRYLNATPMQAHRNLIKRLGSLVMLRNKIRTWVSLSRDRNRATTDVLQEVIQEMLNSDRYIHACIAAIARCTKDQALRNALLLTNLEEYCLRPIRNQPLLVYRFVNYLRRAQRGGMTQVPQNSIVRMVSEEITFDESDGSASLLDGQAIADYQETQAWEEQQSVRLEVQREFERYLEEKVDSLAVRWLRLYLQGQSQEAIASILGLPIEKIYRLREKVSYHAVKGFAIKSRPDLVANWLQITLQEHNLGLTPSQWEAYLQDLTPQQRQLLEQLKTGQTPEAIAKTFNWKISQVMGEWTKLYQVAQSFRSAS